MTTGDLYRKRNGWQLRVLTANDLDTASHVLFPECRHLNYRIGPCGWNNTPVEIIFWFVIHQPFISILWRNVFAFIDCIIILAGSERFLSFGKYAYNHAMLHFDVLIINPHYIFFGNAAISFQFSSYLVWVTSESL